MKIRGTVLVSLVMLGSSVAWASDSKCDAVFAEHEALLDRVVALAAKGSATKISEIDKLLADADALASEHQHLCFGYYMRGQELVDRWLLLAGEWKPELTPMLDPEFRDIQDPELRKIYAMAGCLDSSGERVRNAKLSKKAIAAAMRRSYDQIKHCYLEHLKTDPGFTCKLKVLFVIKGDGTVGLARIVERSAEIPKMEQCVLRLVRNVRFQRPEGGGCVSVKFPFVFRSE